MTTLRDRGLKDQLLLVKGVLPEVQRILDEDDPLIARKRAARRNQLVREQDENVRLPQ